MSRFENSVACYFFNAIRNKIPFLPRYKSNAWKVSKYGVFSVPYFLAFELNTERYLSLRIQPECGKVRTTKNSVFEHFSRSGWHQRVSLIFPNVNEMLCAIWYHLYNFKNLKNTHGGVLLLVNTPQWLFFTFLKSYKWYQIA